MQKALNLTKSDFIIPKIPSSFVAREMKAPKEGSGEAKLYVGPVLKRQELDSFFQFGTQYQYILLKNNLLDYLKKVEIEYVYHKFNEYQEADLSAWQQRYEEIKDLEQNENPVKMEAFCDKRRYYVRSQSGDLFSKQVRRLIVPRVTNIHFQKDETQQKIYILLELNTSLDVDLNNQTQNNLVLGTKPPLPERDNMKIGEYIHMVMHGLDDNGYIFPKSVMKRMYTNEWSEKVLNVPFAFMCSDENFQRYQREYQQGQLNKVRFWKDEFNFGTPKTHVSLEWDPRREEQYFSSFCDWYNSLPERFLTQPYNRILFGAPGTGKSYKLGEEQKEFFDAAHFERVTFHPAYTYAQFFGTYKPVSDGSDIKYEFVCGPFLRVLLKALKHPAENYLLIIEEINRADVAAVFGDVFQLLDRENGRSQYEIDMPEDLKRYIAGTKGLAEEQDFSALTAAGGALADGKLYIPRNLYLWATMNSADQGVMPLDTAFKRRWNFEYLPVDIDDKKGQADFCTPAAEGEKPRYVWLAIRRIINERLKKVPDIAEDRWLGPYFLHGDDFETEERFAQVFKNKVLMYLYQDIAKYAEPGTIFAKPYTSYNELCDDFDADGMKIFAGCNEKYPQKQAEAAKDDDGE